MKRNIKIIYLIIAAIFYSRFLIHPAYAFMETVQFAIFPKSEIAKWALILAVFIIGFMLGIWFDRLKAMRNLINLIFLSREKRGCYADVIKRDIAAVFNNIKKDLKKGLDSFEDGKLTVSEETNLEFIFEKLKSNVEKMEGYLEEEIEDLRK